jgi:hypothetical protein
VKIVLTLGFLLVVFSSLAKADGTENDFICFNEDQVQVECGSAESGYAVRKLDIQRAINATKKKLPKEKREREFSIGIALSGALLAEIYDPDATWDGVTKAPSPSQSEYSLGLRLNKKNYSFELGANNYGSDPGFYLQAGYLVPIWHYNGLRPFVEIGERHRFAWDDELEPYVQIGVKGEWGGENLTVNLGGAWDKSLAMPDAYVDDLGLAYPVDADASESGIKLFVGLTVRIFGKNWDSRVR